MFRFITFVFILAHSVAAQASNFGTVRIETKKWITSFSGETEVDGLPVTVNLEVSKNALEIPAVMAGGETFVPFISVDKRAYRLTFIVSHSPRIQTSYAVEPRNVSIEGMPRFAYVSEQAPNRDYAFVVTAEQDGALLVNFSRRLPDGENTTGQIVLSPIPNTMK
jgi:hypothetical protein